MLVPAGSQLWNAAALPLPSLASARRRAIGLARALRRLVHSLEPGQWRGDAPMPSWVAAKQPRSIVATQLEPALIAAEAAERSEETENQRVKQPLRRGDAAEQHEGLALEKRPDERDRVDPIA